MVLQLIHSHYEKWQKPGRCLSKIRDIGVKDISMEVVGSDLEMNDEGIRLYEKFGDVATIKVPCTREGLIVCKRLSEQRKVNVTLSSVLLRQSYRQRQGQHMFLPL